MGSYYSTGKTIREYDARILAVIIAAFGVTDANAAMAIHDKTRFTVDTDYGPLEVMFSRGWQDGMASRGKVGLLGCVFTRFADPTRAAGMVDSNPFSGKWNFHFAEDHGYKPEHMLRELARVNPRNFKLLG